MWSSSEKSFLCNFDPLRVKISTLLPLCFIFYYTLGFICHQETSKIQKMCILDYTKEEHAVCGWESQNMQCVCVCCSFRSPQAGCLTNSVSGSHEVCLQFFFNGAWFVQYLDLCVCAHTASLNGNWNEL